jgi:hypothetical protein
MFKWLFRKKQEAQSALEQNGQTGKTEAPRRLTENDVASRIQDLQSTFDPGSRSKLVSVRSRMTELVITSADKARDLLEATNRSRQRVWGDKAVQVPILYGAADSVFCALLECVVADYAGNEVASFSIEEIAVPETDEETKRVESARGQMRPDLDADDMDYYEKKMMKHMRKRKDKDKTEVRSAVREMNLRVHFRQTFGDHRIIRVSQDEYYFLPCSKRE